MINHMIQFKIKYCDYPGYEYTGYCGAVNNYGGQSYPDHSYTENIDSVNCEDCQTEYGLRLLSGRLK